MSDLISREQAISKSFYIQTDGWWGDVVSVENLMELPEVNLIEELEKIKEEFEEEQDGIYGEYGKCGYTELYDFVIGIINKHIAELKGENNG